MKKKEKKKVRFKYQALTTSKTKVTGFIDGYDKDEIKTFLENEGLTKVNVRAVNSFLYQELGGEKLKYSDLSFILTQLSTYIKAGIPLIDAVRILQRQSTKSFDKRLFNNVIFELVKGESFSNALAKAGDAFPKLLISMVKTAEKTGDLESILDDMAKYYSSIDKTRKQVVSSMTYPLIILLFSLVVVTFILIYIVPQFVSLFNQNNADIPGITKFVIATSNFVSKNFLVILLSLIVIVFGFKFLYRKIKGFRKTIQIFLMKLPVIGKVIINKEVAMFTKTFASLLEHKIFITDTMEILSDITSNVVYEEIINESIVFLSKGAKISDAFKGKWAFPVVAYEMIVTGENTGKLPIMMNYVASYYDDLYQNAMKRLNIFIEPTLIVLLSLIVGVVVLSIVIPMFSFYATVG